MLLVIGVIFILLLQEHTSFYVADDLPVFFHKCVSLLGYSLRPVVIVLFIALQRPDRSLKLQWGLVIMNALIHMTTFFSAICFSFTEDGSFYRGPLGYTSFVVCGTTALLMLAMTYHAIYNTIITSPWKNYGFALPMATYIPILYLYLRKKEEKNIRQE